LLLPCALQASDRAFQTLLQVQQRDGQLRLNNFRRVKQLGAGDVGLVDLVQLQVSGWVSGFVFRVRSK
jgi:hypothetical protein